MSDENKTSSLANAVFLFAFPPSSSSSDDDDEETYAQIRLHSKLLKEAGCKKVIESFSLKTSDATHVVCASETEYGSLWEESQNDAHSFFDFFEDDESSKAPPVKCTFEFARRSAEAKTLLDVNSNILFRPPKTSLKILKGLKICQTSYTGPRRNDVKTLIERLGAEYSKPFDKTCTHLCCYQFEGKKYEKAVSDGTTIVSHAWLEACYVSGEKVDASRYMRSGEEEDALAQEKDVVPDSEAEDEEKEEQQEERREEIEDAIEDVVCVVDMKKSAQKIKENSNNNDDNNDDNNTASGSKNDDNESAKSIRFEVLKKLNNNNNVETQEDMSVYEMRVNKVSETPTEPSVEKTTVQKEKEDEETEIPATEARAKPVALAREEEQEEEEEEAHPSTDTKKYPSPDYNNLPPEQVERCVRNIIDPTHSKSSNEFQGLLADADDVEAALNNGGKFAMANSFPRFGDGDGPLCKAIDDDSFFELLMAGKIPTLANGESNSAKIDRVSKGERVFEVLRDMEDIDVDLFRSEFGVEVLNVSKGRHKVHQTRREAKSDTYKAVCFSLKKLDDDNFAEILANALACLNEADRYGERGPLGRAVTSRLALERAQNGTLLNSNASDDPDALLATLVNVYLRFGYNYTPRAVRETFMTNNGTKIIQDLNFVVTLPERKPGNLPNVVLESVDRSIGQVVAGFFELLAGPTQPDLTQRVQTQPSARKENISQQMFHQSPPEGVDLTQLATQLATQPPAATQTWEPTSENEENVDEEQEGEENGAEEPMPALEEEEEEEFNAVEKTQECDEQERSKEKKHYISGSMEKSTSKSNNGGYKTAQDTQATAAVDDAEEDDEAPPVLEPVPVKRMTRQRREQSTRICAPTAEQQRKSLERSPKEEVDKSSAKQKGKTTKRTASPPPAPKTKRKAMQIEKALLATSIKRGKSSHVRKVATKKLPSVVRVALSGFNSEDLKKRVSVLKKLNIPYASSGHDWDESVTHVIFGARGTRSLKFLAALASGAHVLNESYLDECEEQNSSRDSMPPIEDKHFFKGGRGLENKLICASASKFWYGWHASASKPTTNRGMDASSTIKKPFSNLDIAVASFGSNANAKGEHQMVCDVLRVGGANVRTISANGEASLPVHATITHEDKMDMRDSDDGEKDEDEEDAVDIIVCNEDKAESGRVKKAMDAYPDALVVSSEYIKRFLSSPGDDLSAYALFETIANEKVEDALIKRRLGGPHAVSLGAEKQKKRKFLQSSAPKTKIASNKKANALPKPPMKKTTKPAATSAKKKNVPTRAVAAKRFPVEQEQTRAGRRATRALGTIN